MYSISLYMMALTSSKLSSFLVTNIFFFFFSLTIGNKAVKNLKMQEVQTYNASLDFINRQNNNIFF